MKRSELRMTAAPLTRPYTCPSVAPTPQRWASPQTMLLEKAGASLVQHFFSQATFEIVEQKSPSPSSSSSSTAVQLLLLSPKL